MKIWWIRWKWIWMGIWMKRKMENRLEQWKMKMHGNMNGTMIDDMVEMGDEWIFWWWKMLDDVWLNGGMLWWNMDGWKWMSEPSIMPRVYCFLAAGPSVRLNVTPETNRVYPTNLADICCHSFTLTYESLDNPTYGNQNQITWDVKAGEVRIKHGQILRHQPKLLV